jgi:hypothetical protein
MGQAIVTLPDGRKARVTFDSPEQLDAVVNDLVGQKQEQPAQPDDTGRNMALAGRAVGQGVANTIIGAGQAMGDMGTGGVAVDAMLKAQTGKNRFQHEIASFNKTFGTKIPEVENLSQLLSAGLTEAGAPVPETNKEKLASAAVEGTASALTGGAMSGMNTVPNVIRAGLSGASGGASAEFARQKGVGPIGQFLSGLAGGMAPSAIEGAGRAVVRATQAAGDLAKPLTRAGQEEIAGNVLASNATDVQSATQNLKAAQPRIPGSEPTAGPASEDVGLLSVEKGLRSKAPADFGVRNSEQNAARQATLDQIAGSPADITAAKAARDAATAPMRQAALGSGNQANTAPVSQTIDAILSSPQGKRQTISSTMEWVKQQIGDNTDPAALYEIRKDLQLAQQGKLQPSSQNAPNTSTLAQARGELGKVVSALDDSIEQAAPGFKAYLARYKQLSQPIDQMKVLQQIQQRSALAAGADITTGRDFLSPAKFGRELQKAIQPGTKLTQPQIDTLNAIKTDLDYGAAINSPLVKAPGSDTFQNLSIANAIGAGAAKGNLHPALQALTKPLKWLYKAPDDQITQILTQAMLDPKLAARLLERANQQTVASFSNQLRAMMASYSIGATTAAASRSQSGSPEADSRRSGQRQ